MIECSLQVFSVLFHILNIYQHLTKMADRVRQCFTSTSVLQIIISCSYLSESPRLRPPDDNKGHTIRKECVRHRTARMFRSRLFLFDGGSSHHHISSCVLAVLPFQYSLCIEVHEVHNEVTRNDSDKI